MTDKPDPLWLERAHSDVLVAALSEALVFLVGRDDPVRRREVISLLASRLHEHNDMRRAGDSDDD